MSVAASVRARTTASAIRRMASSSSHDLEHDLARHAGLPEQLVRLSRLGNWKSPCDEWLDLVLLEEVEQGDQILPEQRGAQPCGPLDTVGDLAFPPWEKPAAHGAQPDDGGRADARTKATATR